MHRVRIDRTIEVRRVGRTLKHSHSPLAPSERCDVHESAVVQEALLGTALWRFLLLLLLYFGCLRFNLTGSGERSVNFAHVVDVL